MANLIEIIAKDMRIRNYSPRTIETYTRVVADLYKVVKKPPRDICVDEIKDYLYQKQQSGLSSQSIAVIVNAINFLYTQIYHRENFQKFRHPKKTNKLPEILSKNEINLLIQQTTNKKHQTILGIAYAAGLRVSEVVNLRVKNIGLMVKNSV